MASIFAEVRGDITKCEEVILSKDENRARELVYMIISSYSDYIKGIREGLSIYGLTDDYLGDVAKLKRKLELYRANGCSSTYGLEKLSTNSGIQINNNNANTNTNTNTNNNKLDIQILIDETRNLIEEDETLSEEEIKEILEKIGEIESVYQSDEPRNKKWFKLRGLMSWVGTKGVVVAASMLNLVTAILKA